MATKSIHNKLLVFPPVVIAHLVQDLADLYRPKIINKSSIEIHYSAQLNGHPHFGTITSMATAFASGEYLSSRFKIPAVFKFEALENAPGEQKKVGELTYCKMLSDCFNGSHSKAKIHMDSFKKLLNFFKMNTTVNYEIESYREFQKNPFVRKILLKIIARKSEFIPFISPSEGYLRIRFPCPECSYMEKSSRKTQILSTDRVDEIILKSHCFEHGGHSILVKEDNDDFVDFNTAIRNVIKEAKFIEDAKMNNAFNLMVDGGDWVGMTGLITESLGLLDYHIRDLPSRLFTPIIEDWSGAKFSKSVYVEKGTYKDVPEEFVNFTKFEESFGLEGLIKVLDEVRIWISDPKKIYRNYSVEYLRNVFNI
ncbi:hypothetical protein HZC30_06105 [Candidatus Woesearchaeota archaeon]|nr:hypothetical protein [Candidatus Woesearchaeota archaeon]